VTSNPTTTSNYSSSISVYDSLGQSHVVNIYFRKAYEEADTGNSTWQWYAVLEAVDSATGEDTLVDWGDLVFNNKGTLISGGDPVTVSFDFSQGANPDQEIALVFGSQSGGGASTQYPIASTTNFQTQDGYPPGVLQNVTVSEEGVISGHYSNGQILDLYQITLANFNNPQGLKREGGNLFAETIDSGPAYTNAAGSGGLGKINSNSLEQSNVDLATEFVKMIIAQRGFQANSRVITSSDEILQELMNLKR
ncbi:MAG TPA: flagellar hook-basal body complex protein, partial [Syntrophorhabdaceae bacterium]|nr:flagellar hook-basal body complex protein [Syntrophorhabdaceae bacterium]HPC67057.1 flagellar hook-basal body complex protein [Syntrophorhabdaceae bacterium]